MRTRPISAACLLLTLMLAGVALAATAYTGISSTITGPNTNGTTASWTVSGQLYYT
jgi:hypothetical protein